MSTTYEIADRFVETFAAADPLAATMMGVPGHDTEITDFSPEAFETLKTRVSVSLREMRAASAGSGRDRICRETFLDKQSIALDIYESGDYLRNIGVLFSPAQRIRQVFDLMPRKSEADWQNIAARMGRIGWALQRYRLSLDEGLKQGKVAARRQVEGVARQIDVWTGKSGGRPFFDGLTDAFEAAGIKNGALQKELVVAAGSATAAYGNLAGYLRATYLPKAAGRDGVGVERYSLWARSYNGTTLDLKDTYRWGWEQFNWVRAEMLKTARRVLPDSLAKGDTLIAAAIAHLDTDRNGIVDGVENFRQWMQDLQDQTIAEMDGRHFDIPGPVKKIEAMIAPPGGALAMYYTGPSEDFSRPGRTWYPTGGKTSFPVWREVSIAYHEGVPGHHFQIATHKYMSKDLSRYQRLMGSTSGYSEGWALYAERLMGELGYLEDPGAYMGMLAGQALRAVRVVIDIGMHLELVIPEESDFHPGETWTPALGQEMLDLYVPFPRDFLKSEIDRYLGTPGQAISYKVGEREWLAAREASRRKDGPGFNLKDWHTRALRLGPMGLAQMKGELAGA